MKATIKEIMTLLCNVNTLLYVASDWGQLEIESENKPIKYPCALINLQGDEKNNQYSKSDDKDKYTFHIRIATAPVRASAQAPILQLDNSLAIYDIIQQVQCEMKKIANCKYLRGYNANRYDGINEYRLVFTIEKVVPK